LQSEAQIPHPLPDNLPELLTASSQRTPPIGITFAILVRQRTFEGATPLIQVKDIRCQKTC
jgi:hypothetical protein